jgi:alanine racemase
MAVVKSNAYGHSILDFSKEMSKLDADYFGVDSIVEGIALRKSGIKKPILILGYTLPEMLKEALEYNLELTVSTFETLNEIKRQNLNKIKVHIKVDTGMGRHGFMPVQIQKVISEIKEINNINVVGLYTHFASAKNPAFPQYTNKQIEIFKDWADSFKKAGFNPIRHACATSGTILFPEAHFDMVRIGIGLYGIWPSVETKEFINNKFKLQPILSWKTILCEIKELPEGSKIGYDSTETLEKKIKVGICPIGYWHGYPRALSSIGKVLIGGKKCKILGRVCMDIIILDISGAKNMKVGDEIVLIGKIGNLEISADDISTILDGSTYELLTRINPLIKRIYV